jgi:ABC-type Na+ efflux pump permease subunit
MSSPPSAAGALSAIARVTLKRSTRGMLPTLGFVISSLPALATLALHSGIAFRLVQLVLVILPPMFVAPSIGDEIDDRTGAYLWSRPVPRWTIVAGKLLALAPMCAAFVAGSAVVAGFAGDPALRAAAPVVAVAASALATCAVVAGIASVLPRHAMIFAIVYLLVDQLLGGFDTSIHLACLSYATQSVAGRTDSSAITGAIALVAIASVWLTIAFRRIRRLET